MYMCTCVCQLLCKVEKVAALPFEEGDSTAVASRLLLIQRLERAVEDGHALLRKDVESSLDEEALG